LGAREELVEGEWMTGGGGKRVKQLRKKKKPKKSLLRTVLQSGQGGKKGKAPTTKRDELGTQSEEGDFWGSGKRNPRGVAGQGPKRSPDPGPSTTGKKNRGGCSEKTWGKNRGNVGVGKLRDYKGKEL